MEGLSMLRSLKTLARVEADEIANEVAAAEEIAKEIMEVETEEGVAKDFPKVRIQEKEEASEKKVTSFS